MEEEAKRKFSKIVSVGGVRKQRVASDAGGYFCCRDHNIIHRARSRHGAAMLAAIGSGLYPDEAACVKAFVKYGSVIQPIAENVTEYQRIYSVYHKVYQQTAPLCRELAALQSE